MLKMSAFMADLYVCSIIHLFNNVISEVNLWKEMRTATILIIRSCVKNLGLFLYKEYLCCICHHSAMLIKVLKQHQANHNDTKMNEINRYFMVFFPSIVCFLLTCKFTINYIDRLDLVAWKHALFITIVITWNV